MIDWFINKKEKDEIKQTAARKNINVDCRANCLFNDESDNFETRKAKKWM